LGQFILPIIRFLGRASSDSSGFRRRGRPAAEERRDPPARVRTVEIDAVQHHHHARGPRVQVEVRDARLGRRPGGGRSGGGNLGGIDPASRLDEARHHAERKAGLRDRGDAEEVAIVELLRDLAGEDLDRLDGEAELDGAAVEPPAPGLLEGRGRQGVDEDVGALQGRRQRLLEGRAEVEPEEGLARIRVEVHDDVVVDQDRIRRAEVDEESHALPRSGRARRDTENPFRRPDCVPAA
jgi:hypothetical protein